jgi:hypothetical protein
VLNLGLDPLSVIAPDWSSEFLIQFMMDNVSFEASPTSRLRSLRSFGTRSGRFAIILLKSMRRCSDSDHPAARAYTNTSDFPRR